MWKIYARKYPLDDQGDRLIATARNPEQIADLAARCAGRARIVPLDVTRFEQADAAIEAAFAAFGRLDVLVNNAGYGNVSSIEETPTEDFRAHAIAAAVWTGAFRSRLPMIIATTKILPDAAFIY